MEFLDIVTTIAVVLTVPMLVRSVLELKRIAATRQPPSRRDITGADKHVEARSG